MFWIRWCSYMTQIIKDWGYWRQKRLSTKFKTVTNIFYLETETRLAIILNLIRNRSKLNSNCFTANSKISTDNPEDGLGSNSHDSWYLNQVDCISSSIVDTWEYRHGYSYFEPLLTKDESPYKLWIFPDWPNHLFTNFFKRFSPPLSFAKRISSVSHQKWWSTGETQIWRIFEFQEPYFDLKAKVYK